MFHVFQVVSRGFSWNSSKFQNRHREEARNFPMSLRLYVKLQHTWVESSEFFQVPRHLYYKIEIGGIMHEWKRHKFLLLFSGARTRDSCVWGSRAIHSATGAEICAFFIHSLPPPLSLFNRFCELSVILLIYTIYEDSHFWVPDPINTVMLGIFISPTPYMGESL